MRRKMRTRRRGTRRKKRKTRRRRNNDKEKEDEKETDNVNLADPTLQDNAYGLNRPYLHPDIRFDADSKWDPEY